MTEETLDRLWETIEGDEFVAEVGVASGFSTLVEGFGSNLAVRELLGLTNLTGIRAVLERLGTLCGKQIDERYENPWDFAITAYLWVLWMKDVELAKIAASFVGEAKNLWWGKYLSNYLNNLETKINDSDSVRIITPKQSLGWYERATTENQVIRGHRILGRLKGEGIFFFDVKPTTVRAQEIRVCIVTQQPQELEADCWFPEIMKTGSSHHSEYIQ